MPYYFSWFVALLFTDQSVYFYISNSVEIVSPVEFANEASHSRLWENQDITLQSEITYIYLCG